jgi:phenylalanyl-tRNA synthetase beta chain
MRVKLEWLKELVNLESIAPEEIVRILSLYSIEVEGVERVVGGSNLVVGFVQTRVPHPDSDHLSVCTVDVGSETLQIVCGAPNVREGQYVVVAKVDAVLPNGLKIKRAKIRGIESYGMICSLSEIGMEKKYILPEYQDGIYYFKEKVEPGSDALKALNFDDETIVLGLTPNRSDLLNMLGVAIEASAVFHRPLKPLARQLLELDEVVQETLLRDGEDSTKPLYKVLRSKEKNNLEVKIESPLCLAYYGQVVKNVRIKPSPWWLISRLIAFGIRPINNVVDITNYILALFGQPLHAFDYDKLGNKILVRNAFGQEKITTLDDVQRELQTNDLVITDGEKPVAIAGVMGGLDTEITSETRNIVIEAAVFKPEAIRQTSTRLGLRSDSSIRFEKGVDLNRTRLALDYACYLLQTYADGEVINDYAFAGTKEIEPWEIAITPKEVNNLLGITIDQQEIVAILKRLRFGVKVKGETLMVSVPNRRPDVRINVDLIEEIARVHGYEKLPETLPHTQTQGGLNDAQIKRRRIRNILNGLGFNEIYTYSLVSEKTNSLFLSNDLGTEISLLMPQSLDHKYLRRSLLPGMVENVRYAYSHKLKNLSCFEIGNVYYQKDGYQEEEHLGLVMTNLYASTLWKGESEKADFYLLKGVLETLFEKLELNVEFRPLLSPIKELHPKMSASIFYDDKNIGFIGAIHPKFAQENDLDRIFVAEVKLVDILSTPLEPKQYIDFNKVPSVERDIAVVVSRSTPVGEILAAIKKLDKTLLSNVEVFDIYTGDKIAADEKSVAIKLEFSANQTLTDEVVNDKVRRILKTLAERFNAVLRS